MTLGYLEVLGFLTDLEDLLVPLNPYFLVVPECLEFLVLLGDPVVPLIPVIRVVLVAQVVPEYRNLPSVLLVQLVLHHPYHRPGLGVQQVPGVLVDHVILRVRVHLGLREDLQVPCLPLFL